MTKSAAIALALLPLGSSLTAETLTSHELQQNVSGYLCLLNMETAEGPEVSLQLSDYKDVWSVNILVQNAPDRFRRFFDERGLRDEEAWEEEFQQVLIGERTFDLHQTDLMEVQRSEVDERSFAVFRIAERHNVAAALNAMAIERLTIPQLVALPDTGGALAEFRTCASAAMGLEVGERVETDFRAEYRMIFERSFESWVEAGARAESCMQGRIRDAEIDAVIERAASAFYPGLLNYWKRDEYADGLRGRVPLSRLSGATAAMESCFMAGNLAEMSFMPVERAIEEAEDME